MGIDGEAWLEVGVDPRVLEAAGIATCARTGSVPAEEVEGGSSERVPLRLVVDPPE